LLHAEHEGRAFVAAMYLEKLSVADCVDGVCFRKKEADFLFCYTKYCRKKIRISEGRGRL